MHKYYFLYLYTYKAFGIYKIEVCRILDNMNLFLFTYMYIALFLYCFLRQCYLAL